ncbi:hypothetical protein HAX54_048028, partial [Datura stramonium]|nr:hypothetical protein [Datura stramonium]
LIFRNISPTPTELALIQLPLPIDDIVVENVPISNDNDDFISPSPPLLRNKGDHNDIFAHIHEGGSPIPDVNDKREYLAVPTKYDTVQVEPFEVKGDEQNKEDHPSVHDVFIMDE